MACNTPFRLYKITTHRGGHSVPFIFSWPAGLDAGDRVVRNQYAHVTDILPTLADLLGLDVPTHRHGLEAEALAGSSFASSLRDPDSDSTHTEQYYECIGHRGFYRDGWEAVVFHENQTPFSEDRWELFHVAEDLNQRHDLAAEHPERFGLFPMEALNEAEGQQAILDLVGIPRDAQLVDPGLRLNVERARRHGIAKVLTWLGL